MEFNKPEFNKKEIKLIEKLVENSRSSAKELATYSGFSKETIASKISYFQEIGLIKAFSIQVNLNDLHLKEYICLIKLKISNKKIIKKLLHFLENSKYTSWIGNGFGNYDIKVSLYVKNQQDILDFENEMFKQFNYILENISFNEVVSKAKNSSVSLLDLLFNIKTTIKLKSLFQKKNEEVQIPSKQQLELLYELSKNSRISLKNLSQILNISIENCSYHLKQLQKNSIIKKYSIVLNGNILQKTWVILLLKVNPNHLDEISTYFLKSKIATSTISLIGNKNLQVTIVINNTYELYDTISTIKDTFENEIFEVEYFFIQNFSKYPKLPKIILEI